MELHQHASIVRSMGSTHPHRQMRMQPPTCTQACVRAHGPNGQCHTVTVYYIAFLTAGSNKAMLLSSTTKQDRYIIPPVPHHNSMKHIPIVRATARTHVDPYH